MPKANGLCGPPDSFPMHADLTTAYVTRTYGKWWLEGIIIAPHQVVQTKFFP